MAIKAGLVGVNPKGVDHNGMPIASDGNGVKETQLTANGKKFFFAYDETSEKYGYKLDGAGDFIPFESAGGGPGWVKPADLITTGMGIPAGLELLDGGFYHDTTNKICYLDVTIKKTSSGSLSLTIPPKSSNPDTYILAAASTEGDTSDDYTANWYYNTTPGSTYSNISISSVTGTYLHLFGMYNTL